ncbi:MAG TPA: rhamnogalacturonan acetylesterase [Verrucomicrobiae bacterium]|nr:rhamnogalacturonan acetylesterase [Verrucomicrobiae bacterium]
MNKKSIALFASAAICGAMHIQASALKFDFGSGKARSGWMQVTPTNVYSDQFGFGFEPGAKVTAGKNSVSGDQPFYFSAKLPEGNYKVSATLGGEKDSTNTVKAELRRLMLETISVPAGKSVEQTFIVNLRTPDIGGTNHVHLKPREKSSEIWDWDDKMTLEFNGKNPSLRSLEIEPVKVPTVFVIGDSTVCDQPAEPWNSWGQMLPRFFKPEIAIANHAESGETVADSLRAQRFEKIFSLMKRGDYLLIQFGHNDMKDKRPDALEVYRSNLKKIVARTRSLGGTPVLITSMERKAGIHGPTLKGYPDAVREVAKEENCALIDLNQMSLVFYKALGDNLDKAFQDGTHHNNYGSYELAQCVVLGIQQDKLPLAKFIVKGFKFDPAHPDDVNRFEMAVSPNASLEKPLGN